MWCRFMPLVLCLAIMHNNAVNSAQLLEDRNSAYQAAYDRWCRAMEANPAMGPPFWVRADIGPAKLRTAVRELLSFGPNLTPFIVAKLRSETDQLHIYRLLLLLDAASGINLYFNSGAENFYEAAPKFRSQFIEDWDSGKYLNVPSLLKERWEIRSRERMQEGIDPKGLTELRRYGVFAIPFIIDKLEETNSSELFAAFLIITGQSNLYRDYLKTPSNLFAGRDQKLSFVKRWASLNEGKLTELNGLHAKVKALVSR